MGNPELVGLADGLSSGLLDGDDDGLGVDSADGDALDEAARSSTWSLLRTFGPLLLTSARTKLIAPMPSMMAATVMTAPMAAVVRFFLMSSIIRGASTRRG